MCFEGDDYKKGRQLFAEGRKVHSRENPGYAYECLQGVHPPMTEMLLLPVDRNYVGTTLLLVTSLLFSCTFKFIKRFDNRPTI